MARIEQQVRQLYIMCAAALVEGRADLDGADQVGFDITMPVFTVGQTAQIAQIHPQTLRQYDRLGLIVPERTEGGSRRYSLRDVQRLTRAQHLSFDEGVNLAGIARILDLEEENRQLRRQVKRLNDPSGNIFAADTDGQVVSVPQSGSGRTWRASIQVRMRELPGRNATYDADSIADSKSIVVWDEDY